MIFSPTIASLAAVALTVGFNPTQTESETFVRAPGNAFPEQMRGQWSVRPGECAKRVREIYLVGQRSLKHMTVDRRLRGHTDGEYKTDKVMIGDSRRAIAKFSGWAGDEKIAVTNSLSLSFDEKTLTLRRLGDGAADVPPLVMTRCK